MTPNLLSFLQIQNILIPSESRHLFRFWYDCNKIIHLGMHYRCNSCLWPWIYQWKKGYDVSDSISSQQYSLLFNLFSQRIRIYWTKSYFLLVSVFLGNKNCFVSIDLFDSSIEINLSGKGWSPYDIARLYLINLF